MKMNPVVHFEMAAQDSKRMVNFYNKVFGWKANQMGPEMGNYVVVTTTESDEKTGRPKTSGSINGGFYPKTDNTTQTAHIVIAVDDIRGHIEKIKKAGGKVLGEPMDIPGVGLYAVFVDTEGNKACVLQPKMTMKE